jgi:hypothetical protein
MSDEHWEKVRRLRYGCLIRLYRHRYGYQLPNDDAGIEDLWLLLQNVSLAGAGKEKKIRAVIETWAPWLSEEEAQKRIDFLGLLTTYELTPTAQELGERLRVTNAERLALKLWQFKPIDATDEELEQQCKARRREKRRAKLRAQGAMPRQQYLGSSVEASKPWQAQGISRATWYRKRETGHVPIIVTKDVTLPVSTVQVESEKGLQGVVRLQSRRLVATKVGQMDRNASSSPELVTDLSQEGKNTLATALHNLTLERERRLVKDQRVRFEKLCARFDALRERAVA